MNDRNKTELTQNITRLACLWMDEHGFKPVETEVAVDDSWIADIASFVYPTRTECINLKLIRRPPPYAYSQEERERRQQQYQEWQRELGCIPNRLTALIEVKTTRSDFSQDTKWNREPPTDLRYLAIPSGLLEPSEYPSNWGVLLFDKEGTRLLRHTAGPITHKDAEQQCRVIASIAIRRDHATRHEKLRELQKRIVLADGERKSVVRIRSAMRFVMDVMDGKSIEDAKLYQGIHAELPADILEHLTRCREAAAKKGIEL